MVEISLIDSNFPHQEYLTPYLKSDKIIWKRDGVRRKINVYTDNFIKRSVNEIPNDGNINICLLLEPLTNPAWTDIYDYIKTDFEKFDLIITHNLDELGDLIKDRPDKFHYSTKCITTSWLSKNMIGLHEKTKMISMPISSKNFSEGHRIRHVINEKYKNQNIIDFYGDGVENFVGEFRDCFIDYKYIIICENTLEKGFNSEKLNDALLSGCIPIYWGSDIYDNNYNLSSIFKFSPDKKNVNFEFDESLNNLDNILNRIIREDPYSSLLESVKHNFNYANQKYQTENNLFEILTEKGFINEDSDYSQIVLDNIVLDNIVTNRTKLTEIGLRHMTDKSWYHEYTDFYDSYFKTLTNPRIIEVGTAGHGSTKMFLDYFNDCYLVGMDIIDYSDFTRPNFKFICGDQTNLDDLKKCVENEEHFDLILDDGGHTMRQQQITFGFLFDYLNLGGYYVIEDLHTSFNPGFIESDCETTTYDMLIKIKNKELPFSNYIDINKQKEMIEKISLIEIYAKNPNDLTDSVTSIIKLNN